VLLTVTTTHQPATDLGYLLVKHPDRVHSFDVPTGTAHVLFPDATQDRCTAALLLDVDPQRLRTRRDAFTLGQYVNDRPYAASSLLAGALAKVFRSALRGESKDRPALAATAIPLEIRVPVLRCRGGFDLASALFEPLGWRVTATPIPLDDVAADHPLAGDSPYVDLVLQGTLRLADALNHLYVLLPVLDDAKHYWVAPDEAAEPAAIDWWLALTEAGGEGMVVKPYAGPAATDDRGRLVQPGVKCRGREYLRIIYGPEYTRPDQLAGLRKRSLGRKRGLALREHGLGLAALDRLSEGAALWRVHELVFAILACESEPVDPRL
jgi:hypothetical protein